MSNMHSEGNHLIFGEAVGRNELLSTVAALHNLISKQGYQDIILDFTNSRKFWPGFMIPLATTCRAYRSDKIDFDILHPDHSKSAKFLVNTNWMHLICPERYEAMDDFDVHHMSAKQFMTSEEHYSVVDQSISLILGHVPGIDRNRIKALEWALNEITDNVLNHSQSSLGGVMQVVHFPKRRRIEFYVCDAGITIPRSLRSGHDDIRDDTSAVRAAIEEGVTRNSQTNQGNGLFGTFKCCEVSGGDFEVLTGLISLSHKPGELHVGRNPIPFSGTFVRASIAYDFERLLEKALVFRGKPHDPGHDFIERKYENEKEWIDFKVAEEITAFGSRDAGKSALNKIENLMDKQTTPIDFDFADIHLISSSFADEVFGRLFSQLGPIRFTQLCHFKNIDPTVRGLIDRAIGQRMGTSGP